MSIYHSLNPANITYNNGKAAVIAHSAKNVTYVDNFSYKEGGIQVINERESSTINIFNNVFDNTESQKGKGCFVLTKNVGSYSTIRIKNNTCVSGSKNIANSALMIRKENQGSIIFANNAIAVMNGNGGSARLFGLPKNLGVTFQHNLWYHASGSDKQAFCIWEATPPHCREKYSFEQFKLLDRVSDSIFGEPVFVDESGDLSRYSDFRIKQNIDGVGIE